MVCDLTGTGFGGQYHISAYVWDDADGAPGVVLAVRSGFWINGSAFWPATSRYVVSLTTPPCVQGKYWVGERPEAAPEGYFEYVAADLNGPAGCPMTNIAPGQGYPSGWQDVAVRFGPTAAMGLGAQVLDCPPTPVQNSTWGRVKALIE